MEDEAWERLQDGRRDEARALATRAIGLNPDAIDSYVILAQTSETLGVTIAFCREAIRIGDAVFGDAIEKAPDGELSFWSHLETRPYLRALHALALALWNEDRRDGARQEAVQIATHALRICPNDNIGFRFLLLEWLAHLGRWNEAMVVARGFADRGRCETAMMAGLIFFARDERSEAEHWINEAHSANPHVVSEMLRVRPRKFSEPEFGVAWRSPEEAAAFVLRTHGLWRSVPGAIDFLKECRGNFKTKGR